MDSDSFKDFAKEMAEYITNYLENIRDRRVLPTVEPGYMKPLLPSEAPQSPENWKDIMTDIERVIMPGVSTNSPVPFRFVCNFPRRNRIQESSPTCSAALSRASDSPGSQAPLAPSWR